MQGLSVLSQNLINNKLEKVPATALEGVPLIALYFSAKWCGPCKAFTPKLIELYNEVNKTEKRLEIVFVSGDNDEDQFQAYFKDMPWLAVEFDDALDEVTAKYPVNQIPTLIIIDANGNIKHNNVVDDVRNKGAACVNDW